MPMTLLCTKWSAKASVHPTKSF